MNLNPVKWLRKQISADVLRSMSAFMFGAERGLIEPFSNDKAISLASSWAWIAGNLNASVIASTPLRLYARRGTGEPMPKIAPYRIPGRSQMAYLKAAGYAQEDNSVIEITEHPFLDLMRHVNPWRNQTDFTIESVCSQLFMGNAYWLVITSKNQITAGVPSELWMLPAQSVRIVPDEKQFIKGYLYGRAGKEMLLPVDSVVHFREPNLKDLFYGMGRIEAVYYAAQNQRDMDEFDSRTAKNPIPPMVAVMKASLAPEQIREYTNRFNQMVNESARTRSSFLGVETTDMEFKTLGIPPKDLNFQAGRQIRREEIVNAFGQSTALYTDSPSRANVEGALYKWARFELDPFATRFAEKITEKLLPMYDGGDRLFCAFDQIAKEDALVQTQIETADLANRIRTINEVREERGLEPYDDERANDPFYAVPAFTTSSQFGGEGETTPPPEEESLLEDGESGKEQTTKQTHAKRNWVHRASAVPSSGSVSQRKMVQAAHQEA